MKSLSVVLLALVVNAPALAQDTDKAKLSRAFARIRELIRENAALKKRIAFLEGQVKKLGGSTTPPKTIKGDITNTKQILSAVRREHLPTKKPNKSESYRDFHEQEMLKALKAKLVGKRISMMTEVTHVPRKRKLYQKFDGKKIVKSEPLDAYVVELQRTGPSNDKEFSFDKVDLHLNIKWAVRFVSRIPVANERWYANIQRKGKVWLTGSIGEIRISDRDSGDGDVVWFVVVDTFDSTISKQAPKAGK